MAIRRTIQGAIILFGLMVEYHPISAKDQSRLHQLGKKVLLGIFIPRIRIDRGRIWKGDILVADFEELDNLDASTAKLW